MSLIQEQAFKCPNSTFPSLNAGSSLIISFTPSLSTLLGTYLSINLPAPHCPLASSWLYCPTSTQSQILANALCTLNSLLPNLHIPVHTPSLTSARQSGFSAPTLPSAARAHYRMNVPSRAITKPSCAQWLASFLCLASLTFILVNTQMSPPQQSLRTPGLQFHLGHTPSQQITWSEQTEVS